MSNYFDDVALFHVSFQLPVSVESVPPSHPLTRAPGIPTSQEVDFRTAFLFEEISEFVRGYGERDLSKMSDALVDIVWVALGTAHYLGIPFDALWKEVRRANMEKRPWQEGDQIKPRNTMGLEVTKPEGWKPPNIAGVIKNFRKAYGFPPAGR